MDTLIIFCAKYLIYLSMLLPLWALVVVGGRRRLYLILLAVLSLPLAFVVSRALGSVYYNARPFVVDNFSPLISHAPDNGFPSDHMLLATTLGVILFFVHRRLGVAALVLAAGIGFSRVAAGVHHTLDIAGSVAIAVAAVVVAHSILYWRRPKKI